MKNETAQTPWLVNRNKKFYFTPHCVHRFPSIFRFDKQLLLFKNNRIEKTAYSRLNSLYCRIFNNLCLNFNLDDSFKHNINYRQHGLFTLLNEIMERLNLEQNVNFFNWERVVLNNKKTSILDHIYAIVL